MMSNEHVCATENMHSHLKHCTLHTAYSTTLFSITYSKILFISFYFTSVLISSSLIYSKQNRTGASSDLLSTVCKNTYNHVNMYKQKKKKSKKKRKKNTETQYKPTILSNMNAKVTYVQTHIIRHTAKINKQTNKLEITKAQVESGRKRRLQDTIQTIIKTKYASSLARCRGDQWEIGRNVRNVCFCYRQFSLMFLIGSK